MDQPSLELIVHAFCAAKTDLYKEDHKARYINGEIILDSSSVRIRRHLYKRTGRDELRGFKSRQLQKKLFLKKTRTISKYW